MVYSGKVKNGVVVLEDGESLPEGTVVRVVCELEPEQRTLGRRLMKFAGIAKGLPSDMAMNHDHYLHGTPKR